MRNDYLIYIAIIVSVFLFCSLGITLLYLDDHNITCLSNQKECIRIVHLNSEGNMSDLKYCDFTCLDKDQTNNIKD